MWAPLRWRRGVYGCWPDYSSPRSGPTGSAPPWFCPNRHLKWNNDTDENSFCFLVAGMRDAGRGMEAALQSQGSDGLENGRTGTLRRRGPDAQDRRRNGVVVAHG